MHAPKNDTRFIDVTYQNFINSGMVQSIGRLYMLLDNALIEKHWN